MVELVNFLLAVPLTLVLIRFIVAYMEYQKRLEKRYNQQRPKRKYVKRTPEQKAAEQNRVRRAYHKNPSNPRWAK